LQKAQERERSSAGAIDGMRNALEEIEQMYTQQLMSMKESLDSKSSIIEEKSDEIEKYFSVLF